VRLHRVAAVAQVVEEEDGALAIVQPIVARAPRDCPDSTSASRRRELGSDLGAISDGSPSFAMNTASGAYQTIIASIFRELVRSGVGSTRA
jgi:hypothetical protein